MTDKDTIQKVRERLNRTRAALDAFKMKIDALEKEARRLEITLDVLGKLGANMPEADAKGMSANKIPHSSATAALAARLTAEARKNRGLILEAMLSPTTKQQIDAQFSDGQTLTRIEVTERMKRISPNVNEGTVASTLSKLVAEGRLERVDGNKYRRKDAIADAGNNSDGVDLL